MVHRTFNYFEHVNTCHHEIEAPWQWISMDNKILPLLSKVTTDVVECIDELYKGQVDVYILFLTFFLKLSSCKVQVYWYSAFPDTDAHCLSRRSPAWSRCTFSGDWTEFLQLSIQAVDKTERYTSLMASQTWAFPFRLYRWIMDASLN